MTYELPKIDRGEFERPLFELPLNGIKSRGILAETCGMFGVFGTTNPIEIGIPQYEPFTDNVIGIKYRSGGWTVGKKEVYYSKGSKRSLFGCHMALKGETYDVYLCEGETDAMSLSQWEGLSDNPLVVAYGGHPDKATNGWFDLLVELTGDNTLYTCFDNDEAGYGFRDNIQAQWKGKVEHLNLPSDVKDIAELLQRGLKPVWGQFQLPTNILTGSALTLSSDNAKLIYQTTGYSQLDKLIGGYSPGNMILVAAPPKSGKSSFMSQLVVNFLNNDFGKVMLLPLELNYEETMRMLACTSKGKFPSDCTEEEISSESARLADDLYVMRHFGYLNIKELTKVLDLIPRLGIKLFVLDHITAAVTSYESGLTTQLLDSMMSLIQSRINQYGISAIVVTHVNKTETGAKVTTNDLRGSNSLSQIPSAIVGLSVMDDNLTRLHTLTMTRGLGASGEMLFEYYGSYQEVPKKGGKEF